MSLKAADDDVLLSNTTKTKTPSSLAIKNYKIHDSSSCIDDSTASNSTAITTITTSSSGTSLSEWATKTVAEEDSNYSNNVSVNVKATATATNISDGTSSTIIQKQITEEETKEEEKIEGEVVTISVEKPKKNVIFSGIKIREYKRSIGDNPTCICGPPLGLDWSYIDIQFDKYKNDNFDNFDDFDNSSKNRSSDLIPLDEYEKFKFTGYQKRRSREIQYQNEKKLLLEKHSKQKRGVVGGGGGGGRTKQLQRYSIGGMSSSTTQKEQIKQIKMKFLKLQPITSYKREQIILKETNCTKQDVINTTKKIKVIHNQRQSTAALLEIGLGADNNCILPFIEYIQRKIRRYKSGISKQREQELLWENASNNASNTASNTKNAPRRSSMSTTTTAIASPSSSPSSLLSSSLSSSSSGSSIHSTDNTTNTSTNTNPYTIKQYSSNRRISSAS